MFICFKIFFRATCYAKSKTTPRQNTPDDNQDGVEAIPNVNSVFMQTVEHVVENQNREEETEEDEESTTEL